MCVFFLTEYSCRPYLMCEWSEKSVGKKRKQLHTIIYKKELLHIEYLHDPI